MQVVNRYTHSVWYGTGQDFFGEPETRYHEWKESVMPSECRRFWLPVATIEAPTVTFFVVALYCFHINASG